VSERFNITLQLHMHYCSYMHWELGRNEEGGDEDVYIRCFALHLMCSNELCTPYVQYIRCCALQGAVRRRMMMMVLIMVPSSSSSTVSSGYGIKLPLTHSINQSIGREGLRSLSAEGE